MSELAAAKTSQFLFGYSCALFDPHPGTQLFPKQVVRYPEYLRVRDSGMLVKEVLNFHLLAAAKTRTQMAELRFTVDAWLSACVQG